MFEPLIADGLDTPEDRKARGAFFTPAEICTFVAAWAVRDRQDRVLEPSCGDAAFLLAVGDRLGDLTGNAPKSGQIVALQQLNGVELHEGSALDAAGHLARRDLGATIHVGDFFDFVAPGQFDAVVGNPPYVRYQHFTGVSRAKAQRRALEQQVRLTGLASSWAAFVVHAASFLSDEGRLGLVLPAELLSVNYAAPVRRFLLSRFKTVHLVLFEERVFPGVSEEVVLLLAEGSGGTDHFHVHQARNLDDLRAIDGNAASWRPPSLDAKWIGALLPTDAAGLYGELVDGGFFEDLSSWGETYLGAVTGNNRYFTLTKADIEQWKLGEKDVVPVSPPGSRHLRGVEFSKRAWRELLADGSRVYLFYPQEPLSRAAKAYIEHGEATNVHTAYKCRVRSPWWRVPRVGSPHLLLTYMNHEAPRLVSVEAGTTFLNSVHGVRLAHGRVELGRSLLPLATLNSLTLLGAEVVGRSYGGGMLKLEPREADALPVPSRDVLIEHREALEAIRPQLGLALRGGRLTEAIAMVDGVLLASGIGMKRKDIATVRETRLAMFRRRSARA